MTQRMRAVVSIQLKSVTAAGIKQIWQNTKRIYIVGQTIFLLNWKKITVVNELVQLLSKLHETIIKKVLSQFPVLCEVKQNSTDWDYSTVKMRQFKVFTYLWKWALRSLRFYLLEFILCCTYNFSTACLFSRIYRKITWYQFIFVRKIEYVGYYQTTQGFQSV